MKTIQLTLSALLLAGTVACGGKSSGGSQATCASAAGNLGALISADAKTDEDRAKISEGIKVIETRCDADGWSQEAKTCLAHLDRTKDPKECENMLTPAQKEAVEHDMNGGKEPETAIPLEEGTMGSQNTGAPRGAGSGDGADPDDGGQ